MDGFDLRFPKVRRDERGQVAQALIQLRGFLRPFDERLRAVEGKDVAARGRWIEAIGEACFGAGAFVGKWERLAPDRIDIEQSLAVFSGLLLDANEGPAFGFGLNGGDGFAVSEQEVIGFTVAFAEGNFADGDAAARGEVYGGAVLDEPA